VIRILGVSVFAWLPLVVTVVDGVAGATGGSGTGRLRGSDPAPSRRQSCSSRAAAQLATRLSLPRDPISGQRIVSRLMEDVTVIHLDRNDLRVERKAT